MDSNDRPNNNNKLLRPILSLDNNTTSTTIASLSTVCPVGTNSNSKKIEITNNQCTITSLPATTISTATTVSSSSSSSGGVTSMTTTSIGPTITRQTIGSGYIAGDNNIQRVPPPPPTDRTTITPATTTAYDITTEANHQISTKNDGKTDLINGTSSVLETTNNFQTTDENGRKYSAGGISTTTGKYCI